MEMVHSFNVEALNPDLRGKEVGAAEGHVPLGIENVQLGFDIWGTVVATIDASTTAIQKVKIVRSPGGGFFMLTIENGSEYDVWVEAIEEIEKDLGRLVISWENAE